MSFLKMLFTALLEFIVPFVFEKIDEPDKAINADTNVDLRDALHDRVRINTGSVRRGRLGSKDWTQR